MPILRKFSVKSPAKAKKSPAKSKKSPAKARKSPAKRSLRKKSPAKRSLRPRSPKSKSHAKRSLQRGGGVQNGVTKEMCVAMSGSFKPDKSGSSKGTCTV